MYIILPGVGKKEHNAQRLLEYLIKFTLPKTGVAVDRRITCRYGIGSGDPDGLCGPA